MKQTLAELTSTEEPYRYGSINKVRATQNNRKENLHKDCLLDHQPRNRREPLANQHINSSGSHYHRPTILPVQIVVPKEEILSPVSNAWTN